MSLTTSSSVTAGLVSLAVIVSACHETQAPSELEAASFRRAAAGGRSFRFDPIVPLQGAAACLSGSTDEVFQLPAGYSQRVIARENDPGVGVDKFDMLTLNETGRHAGRLLYRTHEVSTSAALSVTDLRTGFSWIVVQREDFEAIDGLVWSPHGTVLFAEEVSSFFGPANPGPEFDGLPPGERPRKGLVYEYDPRTGEVRPLPAVGSRPHEGLRFDSRGNLYGISETTPGTPPFENNFGSGSGAIFKFVPDRRGDLTSGELFALVVDDAASRTGRARWVSLDPANNPDVTTDPAVDSDLAAYEAGATGWGRPEDVEISTTANGRGGANVLFVALTGESKILRVELHGARAFVSNYVEAGVNGVPSESAGDPGLGFGDPDNLALAPNGDLYVAEDGGPGDIWVARGRGRVADSFVPFARLLDCDAEPSGIYFSRNGRTLYVNSQHAGLNGGMDLTLAITRN